MLPSLCPVMAAIPPVSRWPSPWIAAAGPEAARQFDLFTCR
jgi:hypothetical protein